MKQSFTLQYKKQGALCREVKTDCDVPEYCPGDSRDVSAVHLLNAFFPDCIKSALFSA